MAAIQRKLVHKQFNSPMGLYSQQNVKETLNRELNAFGAQGIEIDEQIQLNLANSAVLRAVEEEEQQQMKCETLMVAGKTGCERPSRSRQRYDEQRQRPHTPLHQQQLEQIKTQYLSHQHDITIDRDTVLKINRLATRRNLHKREHSWPPTEIATTTTTPVVLNEAERLSRHVDRNGHEQHVRSTSNDNALQFDETVCKRHGIDVIREKFKSPTRIIEPTAKEVREQRQRQQRQQRQQNQSQQRRAKSGGFYDNGDGQDSHTKEKPKQMVNLVKHEELLRKNVENKSSNVLASHVPNTKDAGLMQENIHSNKTTISEQYNDESTAEMKYEINEINEDVFKTHNLPKTKGFSHPETKAADEDIGLVEPKRQYFEQLASCKKWCSYENLNTASANQHVTAVLKPLNPLHKRQSYSLERGRDARQRKQLPPQKPRGTPKTQRRSMKLATEIKISYDADADQHNIQVKSLNNPKSIPDDLEHIPLPPTPSALERKLSKELNSSSYTPVHDKQDNKRDNSEYEVRSDSKPKSFNEQQHIYDDSCIYLRSLDMQDNTVAYIPAAITIVPSPTEDIMQHWMASTNLKANIKGIGGDDIEMTITPNMKQDSRENVKSSLKNEYMKSSPEAMQQQQQQQQQRQPQEQEQNARQKKSEEPATYVTRLPTTPNGIQLTRQTSVNTKRNTQLNNTYNNTTPMTATDALATNYLATPKTPEGLLHSNAEAMKTYFKTPLEGDKTQPTGIFYTDGEYIYGPYDPSTGLALAHATVRSLQAEQQRHQQQQQQHHINVEIKKDIEAETKNQHKDEIANLTAKYEHIQKSITEHLRQIDAYIENAKTALTTTIATSNISNDSTTSNSNSNSNSNNNNNNNNITIDKPESLNIELDRQEQHEKPQHDLKATQHCETPLKEILRKLTHFMQELKPAHRKSPPEVTMENKQSSTSLFETVEDENMPIVDKVLMDLNMLTTHLSQYDVGADNSPTNSNSNSNQLKPIIEVPQRPATPLNLQFDTRPYPAEASYVTITEEKTNEENPLDFRNHTLKEINEQFKQRQLANYQPAATPPPSPPTSSTKAAEHDVNVKPNYEQLLATDKLITAQTQSQPYHHQRSHRPESEKQQQQQQQQHECGHAKTILKTETPKDDKKNVVFDFITTPKQEQLVEQVIDTLGKLGNESSENKTITHIPATYDEKIKSNLNQQTTTTTTTTTSTVKTTLTSTNKEEDVAIRQNCNTSLLTDAPDKTACNHDDPQHKRKPNESQLKLHIMNSADIRADKQFQKYDNVPTMNTNDNVVNNKPGQRQYETYKHNKHDDDEPKNLSDSSSGSELSNTYKSSYELPSPYVTMRQISWEDMLPKGITSLHATLPLSDSEAVLTTSVSTANSKHDKQISAANSRKSTETLLNIEPSATTGMTSGHVEMQSTTTSKPRIQTRQQPQQHHHHHQHLHHQQQISQNDDILHMQARKYPAPLIEPHLPTRSTSPFGLNVVDNNIPAKHQRSPTPSPARSPKTRTSHEQLMQSIRKYPSPLVEPHVTTRATSPFGLNAAEIKNVKRSSRSKSPTPRKNISKASPPFSIIDDEPTRKYPAPLVEPEVPTRAASPFGLNAVDLPNSSRATTPMPASVDADTPIRKYPASLVEPHAPKRAASPFGLNAVDISYATPVTTTKTMTIYQGLAQEVANEEDGQRQEQVDEEEKRLSPIRKYPQSLIEPNAPKRAASPFGLNSVDTKQKARSCTSPARVHHETKEATSLQSHTNAEAEADRKTTAYVPQVEGHNIGLLVRTPHLSNTTPVNTTPHDYSAMTSNDFSNNRYCGKNNIARSNNYNNDDEDVDVDDDDDDAEIEVTSDELQRINTIASRKQDITRESMEQTTHSQQHDYQDHRLQHMAADTVFLQTSVINRSFDNVSPRPYNTIEGYKRVAWPPASEERIVREFTPQPQTQYPPVPAYQQQQQQQPSAAVPSTQGPIYNNVQQQQQHHQQHQTPTNTNNFARETISPYNQNQNQYEAYPPQQPETPIVLVDKQFSRQASHEPIQTNSVPYQQQQLQQYQQQQQQQSPPTVQPQNQPMQQQHQPSYNQQIYQQQYQPNNQQNVSYPQQQQQQTPLQQQQQQQNSPSTPVSGWKPIHAPQPKQEPCYTKPVVGANDYLTSTPIYQQQFQNYHQQPQYQQAPEQQQQHQQQYRAPSHDTYQQPQQPQYQQPPQQQQQQYSPQPQYQAPAPAQNQYQPQYQGQGQQVPQYQQQQQQQPQYQPQVQAPQTQQYPQPPWVQQPQQPAQQQYQQPPWVQQPQQQQQPPQQQYQQPQYQTPLNQYQAPHQQYQPQPQQNQFVSQPNQQFNSYSQPQQQQHTVSHDQLDNLKHPQQPAQSLPQEYRGASPGIITLRKEAPVTQKPAPVYTSQPAAVSYMGGNNMRGDLKWPPPEYKEAAVKENQERRELAAGPVCRPRQVKRDYTTFFAKNALSHHYPSYKVPPGTQHMTY